MEPCRVEAVKGRGGACHVPNQLVEQDAGQPLRLDLAQLIGY
jgi:hypothetical protein